jgi:isoleucyl-tRNA synthetase
MSEEIWQNLSRGPMGEDVPESVHLCNYPEADASVIDEKLTQEFALVREVASLGRAARSGAKMKTRQPLTKVIVVLQDMELEAVLRKHEQVLLDELNVKAISIAPEQAKQQYVNISLKPNFKSIGAKYRELVPFIKEKLARGQDMKRVEKMSVPPNPPESRAYIQIENVGSKREVVELDEKVDVEVILISKEGYAANSGRFVVVVLDTHLTPELLDEGVARELISRINEWRGDLKLPYEQRIKLAVKGGEKLEAVARKFAEHIAKETLASEQLAGQIPDGYETLEVEVDGEKLTLGLLRA